MYLNHSIHWVKVLALPVSTHLDLINSFVLVKARKNKLVLCSVCDESRQRNIRLTKEASLKANYKERLGTEVFDKADEFKQWLEQQENRNEITQYLITKL